MEAFWSRGRQCIKMAGTSRRPNVVTPQRRDIESTYIEVNKWQRRDVSTSYSSQSLKAKGGPEFRGDRRSRNVRTRARKSQQADFDFGEEPSFCIFFFSDRKTDVL